MFCPSTVVPRTCGHALPGCCAFDDVHVAPLSGTVPSRGTIRIASKTTPNYVLCTSARGPACQSKRMGMFRMLRTYLASTRRGKPLFAPGCRRCHVKRQNSTSAISCRCIVSAPWRKTQKTATTTTRTPGHLSRRSAISGHVAYACAEHGRERNT